jgi:thiamine-phosphate diphosphorylase
MDLDTYLEVAESAARGGCDAIHIRAPQVAAGRLLQSIRDLRERLPGAMVIVNDRLDLALLGQAQGVQLGENSVAPSDARLLCGDRLLIGRSIHDSDGARRAEREGANYLLAGHVFATPSKPGLPGRGLEWLAGVTQAVSIPVIALGGINIERVPEVLAAGAYGVAMGRELLHADNPTEIASAAQQIFLSQKGTRYAAG